MRGSLSQYDRPLRPRVRLRRVVWTIHRWVGLASGAVVVVVALTGALYALAPEITELYLRRYARVTPPAGDARPLPASVLVARAETAAERAAGPLPEGSRRWLTLSAARERSAVYVVAPAGSSGWYEVYVDPHRGEVRFVRDMGWDPIGVILRAHQSLLLPAALGRRVVGLAVLLFVVSLLTGAVLWLPRRLRALRRRGALRHRFTIAVRDRAGRLDYDLHRVLGGYALAVALVLALTGLTWSFAWMDHAVYRLVTGGATPRPSGDWRSDDAPIVGGPAALDVAVAAATRTFPGFARLEIGLAAGPGEPLSVCANPEPDTSHRAECLWFDRHTGRLLGAERDRDRNAGDRLRAMTYDIHTGRIAGLPGRVVAFLASLAAASLPITGALVWWNRR
jgi:uncharacterized iron-regulated membrane protein